MGQDSGAFFPSGGRYAASVFWQVFFQGFLKLRVEGLGLEVQTVEFRAVGFSSHLEGSEFLGFQKAVELGPGAWGCQVMTATPALRYLLERGF